MFGTSGGKRRFQSLSAKELMALAISSEEEDGHIYRDIAAKLDTDFPATAKIFREMAGEEDEHRGLLIDLYRSKFGEHIPLIRRSDISDFMPPPPVWLAEPLNVEKLWAMAEMQEKQNQRFYQLAAARSEDASIRKLLGDLAAAEASHTHTAQELQESLLTEDTKHAEAQAARKQFVLQIVQPGLAGLMDGSVSTLAPLFAAAFATHNSHATLMVGLAAAVGAGISMGLTEGMSDDGKISGRGNPWVRGTACGVMTVIGGLGHTLPYLLSNVALATWLAMIVVGVELVAIAYIRFHYMDSPFWRAIVQVILGGALVVAAGILLGAG